MGIQEVAQLLSDSPELVIFYPILLFAGGGFAFYKILLVSIKNNREREKDNQQYNEKREEKLHELIKVDIKDVGDNCKHSSSEIKFKLDNIDKTLVSIKEEVKRLSI